MEVSLARGGAHGSFTRILTKNRIYSAVQF
jgi:hypothetical protein